MKFFLGCILCVISLFADEYFATIEPINTYTIKAVTSGKVVFANKAVEGAFVKNSVIIELDKELNILELKQTIDKIKILEQMIEIESRNYERIKGLTSKSEFEKDVQKMKVLNYELQKNDLLTKKITLEDTIKNKTISESNKFIYNIAVKEGDFVGAGTLLYEAKDLSQGKLELFVPIEKAMEYKRLSIYLDGVKTNLKINKLYQVADSKFISSYKCEIVIANPKKFSKLVKVEFK